MLTRFDAFKVRLTTASGSRYLIEWDRSEGTLTREPKVDEEHPYSVELRRDGETVPLINFDKIEVGHPTTFVIDVRNDGVKTFRWANATVELEHL